MVSIFLITDVRFKEMNFAFPYFLTVLMRCLSNLMVQIKEMHIGSNISDRVTNKRKVLRGGGHFLVRNTPDFFCVVFHLNFIRSFQTINVTTEVRN